jgi:hypothetical protein
VEVHIPVKVGFFFLSCESVWLLNSQSVWIDLPSERGNLAFSEMPSTPYLKCRPMFCANSFESDERVQIDIRKNIRRAEITTPVTSSVNDMVAGGLSLAVYGVSNVSPIAVSNW